MSGIFQSSVSGMRAQQTRLDTVANNLANLNTPGFRSARVDLADLAAGPLEAGRAGNEDLVPVALGGGVAVNGTTRSFSQGALQLTENPLDLAIVGDGFFEVTTPGGGTAYTRTGTFSVDGEGRLTTGNGDLITPPIDVLPGTTISHVSSTGVVFGMEPGMEAAEPVGQIMLARFPNPHGLAAAGGNLFVETEASGAAEVGLPGEDGFALLSSGMLESSNVDLAEQATLMIGAQRAYAMNLRSVQALDEMIGLAIQLRS